MWHIGIQYSHLVELIRNKYRYSERIFLLLFFSWSYGVVMWEIATVGNYHNNTVQTVTTCTVKRRSKQLSPKKSVIA